MSTRPGRLQRGAPGWLTSQPGQAFSQAKVETLTLGKGQAFSRFLESFWGCEGSLLVHKVITWPIYQLLALAWGPETPRKRTYTGEETGRTARSAEPSCLHWCQETRGMGGVTDRDKS